MDDLLRFFDRSRAKLGWSDDRSTGNQHFLELSLCMAGLARVNTDDPRYALRTGYTLDKYELGNGFAELSDAEEQRRRFIEEQNLRRDLGKRPAVTNDFFKHFQTWDKPPEWPLVLSVLLCFDWRLSISDLMPIRWGEILNSSSVIDKKDIQGLKTNICCNCVRHGGHMARTSFVLS